MRSLTALAQIEIVGENLAIHRMRALVDNLAGTFDRIFMTKVGDTLVGYDDVDRMFAVVGKIGRAHV